MRRRFVIRAALIAMTLPAARTPAVWAQVPPSDIVVAIVESHRPDASAPGVAGSVEWFRRLGEHTGISAGGYSLSMPGVRWTYGRAGSFTRWGDWSVSAGVDVGSASAGNAVSLYHRLDAAAARPVLSGRVVLEGGAQRFSVFGAQEHVFRAGTTIPLRRRIQTNATYYLVDAASGWSPAFSTRLDIAVKRVSVLAGVAGSSRPGPALPDAPPGVGSLRSRELFAGFRFSTGAGDLLTTATVLHSAGRRTFRAQAGVSIPLRKPRTEK